jgi:hypothetical protein
VGLSVGFFDGCSEGRKLGIGDGHSSHENGHPLVTSSSQ